MDDIKLPSENDPDDDRLFIRAIDSDDEGTDLPFEKKSLSEPPPAVSPSEVPQNLVTIQFSKFVQLVANHSYLDVIQRNADEIVVISGNLLTDLANAHDRNRERRIPLVFIGGLVLGVFLAYLLLN